MTQLSPETKRVLIVDDEPVILEGLTSFLEQSGFAVSQAANGVVGLEQVEQFDPDIIVLDVMMPELNGKEMLKQLRANDDWTPIILLTQVGTAADRALAITEGADDYLNKPYDPYELVARINAIFRRHGHSTKSLSSSDVLESAELQFDRRARVAKVNGTKINLTARAKHLLEYFMLHPDEALHRDRILEAVWGWNFATGTRSVDARVVELRKAIGEHSDNSYIETVPNHGYQFVEPAN